MCRKATDTYKMVTPTKVKFQQRTSQQHHQNRGGKGWTPPPKQKAGPQTPPPAPPSLSGSSSPSRGSPCFAGSKCFEPPTPDSLPKPPTSWTPTKPAKKQLFLNSTDEESANQHLKMLLNVQA